MTPPPPPDRTPKPVTAEYLTRAAHAHLERYGTSAENLRRVLLRKAARRLGLSGAPGPEVAALVEAAVARLASIGLVNDDAYAATKVASLARRGASTRGMRARLAAKGVPAETIAAALAEAEPDELALARRYAERRRLGPWRPRAREAHRERDLAALCRQGFSYGIARAAIEDEPDR